MQDSTLKRSIFSLVSRSQTLSGESLATRSSPKQHRVYQVQSSHYDMRATKFKTTKFNSEGLFQLFTKISTHKNNPLYGTIAHHCILYYITAILLHNAGCYRISLNILLHITARYSISLHILLHITAYTIADHSMPYYITAYNIAYHCIYYCTSLHATSLHTLLHIAACYYISLHILLHITACYSSSLHTLSTSLNATVQHCIYHCTFTACCCKSLHILLHITACYSTSLHIL